MLYIYYHFSDTLPNWLTSLTRIFFTNLSQIPFSFFKMSDFYSQVVSLPVINYQLSIIKKLFNHPKRKASCHHLFQQMSNLFSGQIAVGYWIGILVLQLTFSSSSVGGLGPFIVGDQPKTFTKGENISLLIISQGILVT